MSKTAYLTIDDAPSEDFVKKMEFLKGRGIRAIWFCQGNLMEQRPEVMVEAIRRGEIIGNHSYSHPHFSDLSLDQCYAEIRATDAVIEELYRQAGKGRERRVFRFPYGDKGDGRYGNNDQPLDAAGQARREGIQGYLRRLGYAQPVFPGVTYAAYRELGLADDADAYWTFDTLDWSLMVDDPPCGLDSMEKVVARLDEDAPEEWLGLNTPGSSEIILIHDHAPTAELFTRLVDRMLEKDIRFAVPR